MKETIAIISGWAHGLEAVQPMADALSDRFTVQTLTGAQVLSQRAIPETDYIVTGSMGGLLAVELLPVSCRRLVLLSSTARFCAAQNYPCGTPERVLRRMILQLSRQPEAVLDEFFRNVHHPFRESRQAIAARRAHDKSIDELAAGLNYLLHSDLRDRIPEVRVPVLLLHGAQDQIIPAAASEWLHARLPVSQLKIIDNDGHALPAHHFGTVMQAIRAFLEQRP